MRAKVVGGKYWYQYRGPGDGVGFHYDKDEGMASDQMIMRFPMYSTVTYIEPKGAPTIILNQTIIKNGNVEVPGVPDQGWFVYPKVNKVGRSSLVNECCFVARGYVSFIARLCVFLTPPTPPPPIPSQTIQQITLAPPRNQRPHR